MRLLPGTIALLFFLISSGIQAQDSTANRRPKKDKEDFNLSERLFTGGNLGLSFGTITVIDVSPVIGLNLSKRLSVGAGPIYLYFNDRRFDYSTQMYGGRIFSRVLITDQIFGHAEYEGLNREVIDINYNTRRRNVVSLYVGGGYRQEVGNNSFMMIMALWNLNETIYSPYSNPIIRGGFVVGI